jgi:hypothetical protein
MEGFVVDGVLHKDGRILHSTAPFTPNQEIERDVFVPVTETSVDNYLKLLECTHGKRAPFFCFVCLLTGFKR